MKDLFKYFIVLVLIFSKAILVGQNSTEVEMDLDVLRAPQSPASSLLGIADSEITRPSDATDFMVNLRQATDNFTSIPVNYAVDFAPVWLFGAKNISGADFLSNSIKKNVPQSLIVSFAVNNEDVTSLDGSKVGNTAVALGVKFSLLRGKIKDSTQDALDKAYALSQENSKTWAEVFSNLQASDAEFRDNLIAISNLNPDSETFEIEIQLLTVKGEIINQRLISEAENQIEDKSQEFIDLSKDFDFNRVGFKLDFQSAISWDFPEQIYADRKVQKAGVWLTAALEGNNNLSFLALARYQHMPNTLISSIEGLEQISVDAFDAGSRLMYAKNKFAFSGEIVYRNALNTDNIDGTTKWAINAEYAVTANQKLIFSYGKDFDGTITEDGNVLTALNFLMGFGSKRKVGGS